LRHLEAALSSRRSLTALLGLTAAGALALSGCASNSEGGSPTGTVKNTVAAQQDLATLVPAPIKSAGKLVVGVNVPYSPNEYIQNGKVVGFDVDLMNATAKVLGLTTEYRQADFEKIVPSVKSGTFTIGMSSFTDTKEREKQVDFVTYFSAGVLWASPKGKTVDPLNACGMTVAVQSNTYEQTDELPGLSKKCTAAGKPALKVLRYTSQDSATTAVVLGKAQAMSADSPVTSYAIKQTGGKLQQAGQIREAAPYGWAVQKGSGLGPAMQKAVQSLIKDGTYLQICKKWGVQAGAITTSVINGATS
jgi:polar amino acid transport system substrate-binding protein